MYNWYGEWELDDDDYKEIAKLVWEDDKKDIIEFAIKNQKEQFNIIVTVPEDISFEDFYKDFDTCVFMDYEPKNWKEREERYINDWKYEHHVMED